MERKAKMKLEQPLTMKEVETRKATNGYKSISTFSGAGGSCLGFELAGYDILWANEFIPAAQAVYKLNHSNYLETRDIRKVKPDEILEKIGLEVGELDVLEGSPPCASFSTAGKGSKEWGQVKKYSDSCQRTDDLFFEYARLLEGLQPRSFVAENVTGLVKGHGKGYFKLIMKELKSKGYNVKAKILNSAFLDVPQRRERVIFVGIRKDLKLEPTFPKPQPYTISLETALKDLKDNKPETSPRKLKPGNITYDLWRLTDSRHRSRSFQEAYQKYYNKNSFFTHIKASWKEPVQTIIATVTSSYHPDEARSFSIPELKRICTFPDDFKLVGSIAQQWERLGRSVPPLMMYHIAKTLKETLNKADDTL